MTGMLWKKATCLLSALSQSSFPHFFRSMSTITSTILSSTRFIALFSGLERIVTLTWNDDPFLIQYLPRTWGPILNIEQRILAPFIGMQTKPIFPVLLFQGNRFPLLLGVVRQSFTDKSSLSLKEVHSNVTYKKCAFSDGAHSGSCG